MTSKKVLSTIIALSFLISFVPSITVADTESATGTSSMASSTNKERERAKAAKEKMEEMRERGMNEMRMKMASTTPHATSTNMGTTTKGERRDERLDAAKMKVLERMRIHAIKILRRHIEALDRYMNVSTRLASHIAKLEARGVNLSESRTLLAIANTKIADAKSLNASLKIEIEGVLTGEITREKAEKVRELLKRSEDAVKGAHRALVDVIRSIRAARQLRDGTATSTSNGTSTPLED